MKAETVKRGMMGFPCEEVSDPEAAWREAVAADKTSKRLMYIHIPFCRSRCPFCPFYLEVDSGMAAEYVRLLKRELRDAAPALGRHPVNTVYFGGGTPSELAGDELAGIIDTVRECYPLAADCEITVEGRIDGFPPEKATVLAGHGVNRLSIGIQTFHTELRRRLGRSSDRDFMLERLKQLSELNLLDVTVDLLYGLPGQTMEMWEEDLDTLFDHTRISGLDLYRLNVHGRLPLAGLIAEGSTDKAPEEETVYRMYSAGVERMRREGAVRLSPQHFALDARERNLHNTLAAGKAVCLPFGMKAGGRLSGWRFSQHTDFELYRECVLSGRKPLAKAGRFPADFEACAELSGQIYRQRRIIPERIARFAPGALSALKNGIQKWSELGYLAIEPDGSAVLTEQANYSHRPLASDLMERIAEAFQ